MKRTIRETIGDVIGVMCLALIAYTLIFAAGMAKPCNPDFETCSTGEKP